MSESIATYGGVADGSYAYATLTFSNGSPNVSSSTGIWSVADEGKEIMIQPDRFTLPFVGGIDTVSSSTAIILDRNMSGVGSAPASGSPQVVCWGATNNATAIAAFTSDHQNATPVSLLFPATGTGIYFISPAVDHIFDGVLDLTIEGAGAYLAGRFSLGAQFSWTALGLNQTGGKSARIKTVLKDATVLELTEASKAAGHLSRFSVGDNIQLGGYDLQGSGFPHSQHFFEYKVIIGIDAGSGKITVDSPLRHGYKDTWPLFDAGSTDASPPNEWRIDYGGPATIYRMWPTWDRRLIVNGLGIAQDRQTYASGIYTEINDCPVVGHNGITVTGNKYIRLNVNAPDEGMEADKFVETMDVSGSTFKNIDFQSSSIYEMLADDLTITGFTRTPKRAVITNSHIADLNCGANPYGGGSEVYLSDSNVDMSLGGNEYKGTSGTGFNTSSGWDMVDGVIIIPIITGTANPNFDNAWIANKFIPGNHYWWADQSRVCIRIFKVEDVWRDDDFLYVQTNETIANGFSGGWPSNFEGVGVWARSHPASKATFSNNLSYAGTPDGYAWGMSQMNLTNAPLWSCMKYVSDCTAETSDFYVVGALVSLSMNVTQAYSATGAQKRIRPLGWNHRITFADGSMGDYIPYIDLRVGGVVGGERKLEIVNGVPVYTNFPATVKDTLYTVDEVPQWWANKFFGSQLDDGYVSAGQASITVMVQLDQGIVIEEEISGAPTVHFRLRRV